MQQMSFKFDPMHDGIMTKTKNVMPQFQRLESTQVKLNVTWLQWALDNCGYFVDMAQCIVKSFLIFSRDYGLKTR